VNNPGATPGCFRSSDKTGPCVNPGPVLGDRAEDVWGVFSESFSSVVGMGVGIAPNRFVASEVASLCGVEVTAEFWMLFGDLEKAWVTYVSERKPEDE
jgi:hypothetical protein